MLSPLRRVARLLVLVCVFASGFGPSSKPAPATRSAEPTDPMASTEVRLRKLHLVRPDLILYPIHFDVYC